MGRGITVKSVTRWLLIAFVLWWVITQPVSAGQLASNIGGALNALARFIGSI